MNVLAASTLENNAGPVALLVVLLMAVATVLLIRNMDKRVKRLPREFPEPPPRDGRGPDDDRPV